MLGGPRDIVLIHGLWLTPRSWDRFRSFFEQNGHRVLSPAWPRMHREVEDIRNDPSALAGLGLLEIYDHYERVIRDLDDAPILMGHSMGGLTVQVLLDRGLGAAGVAIDSAQPRGVLPLPWSAIRAASPVLSNPLNYSRTVELTFEQFRYAFANAMGEKAAHAAYERYAVPGPGRPLFQVAFGNLNPWAANRVNFRNNTRAPLLLISGSEDHLVPPRITQINAKKYAGSKAITEYQEFPNRSHLIASQAGWEEVAKYALEWAVKRAVG